MDSAFLIELYGYLGSTLVVVAMLMPSIVKLRVFSTIGSVVSGSYALLIGSFPLALMNGCLIVINVYNLIKLLKTRQVFHTVCSAASDASVGYFLKHYHNDIRTYFPSYTGDLEGMDVVYMVFCGGTPAGILLGRSKENGVVDVVVDYSTPAYRDCSVGTNLYANLPADGFSKLVFDQEKTDAHVGYMKKMGFVEEQGAYVKKLG